MDGGALSGADAAGPAGGPGRGGRSGAGAGDRPARGLQGRHHPCGRRGPSPRLSGAAALEKSVAQRQKYPTGPALSPSGADRARRAAVGACGGAGQAAGAVPAHGGRQAGLVPGHRRALRRRGVDHRGVRGGPGPGVYLYPVAGAGAGRHAAGVYPLLLHRDGRARAGDEGPAGPAVHRPGLEGGARPFPRGSSFPKRSRRTTSSMWAPARTCGPGG